MRAVIIRTNGEAEQVEIPPGQDDLSWLQRVVEGYIEAVPVEGDESMTAYGNEEGKIRGLPANPWAQAAVGDVGLMPGDVLVGTWVFVSIDEEGDTAGLTDDQVALLKARVPSLG